MDWSPARLHEACVRLADVLTNDCDVIESVEGLARTVMRLTGAELVGIALAAPSGALGLTIASTERADLVRLCELQSSEGPAADCYRTGLPVHRTDLAEGADRWPSFSAAAVGAGFTSVCALPMRLREEPIGALSLFGTHPDFLVADSLSLCQAFADVASIGLVRPSAVVHAESVIARLQTALTSRTLIEQAKGVLAERHRTSQGVACAALRDHARHQHHKLVDVAEAVVEGALDISAPE